MCFKKCVHTSEIVVIPLLKFIYLYNELSLNLIVFCYNGQINKYKFDDLESEIRRQSQNARRVAILAPPTAPEPAAAVQQVVDCHVRHSPAPFPPSFPSPLY